MIVSLIIYPLVLKLSSNKQMIKTKSNRRVSFSSQPSDPKKQPNVVSAATGALGLIVCLNARIAQSVSNGTLSIRSE